MSSGKWRPICLGPQWVNYVSQGPMYRETTWMCCPMNAPQGLRWGQKFQGRRLRNFYPHLWPWNFCPHHGPSCVFIGLNTGLFLLCNKVSHWLGANLGFLAATKQLYEWFSPSVRLSFRPSVCPSVTPFWLCSHHRIIMKFSGVLLPATEVTSMQKGKVKGQGHRGHNPTLPFPDCNSSLNSHMMVKWCI